MKKPKVAIIDSGLSKSANICNSIFKSYSLEFLNSRWHISPSEAVDYVGHGTAVSHIILETNPEVDIILFRVCETELFLDEKGLIYVLDYIYNNVEVDIINISAGITYLYDYHALNNICTQLTRKGIIIVSAFDNDGAISYPAALECVVGVDVDRSIDSSTHITLVKNGIVNILVYDKYYRTKWLDTRTIIKGTSFACAFITGLISKQIYKSNDLNDMLQNISTREISNKNFKNIEGPKFDIHKAIVFPVNKESHALLFFQKNLNFEIVGLYDYKLSGKVGTTILGQKIRSYDDINWESDFDTIIISCVSELSAMAKKKFAEDIVDKAQKYDKNIYSFEQIKCDKDNCYYPKLSHDNVPIKNDYKLHKSIIPTVCIVGTSSKQGKYTLQNKLINKLSDRGYNVGSIATEPSGYLLNSDFVFHFGYNANLDLYPYEYISILNEMIFGIQLKNKDILLTSCQSGVIHYNNSNINELALLQYSFLLGIMADVYILCINPHDELNYIKKTIEFLNSIDAGKVIALAVFPFRAVTTLSGIGYKTDKVSDKEILKLKQEYKKIFNLPVYSMDEEDVQKMCSLIVEKF